jgi:hypothetical protein
VIPIEDDDEDVQMRNQSEASGDEFEEPEQ